MRQVSQPPPKALQVNSAKTAIRQAEQNPNLQAVAGQVNLRKQTIFLLGLIVPKSNRRQAGMRGISAWG